MENDPEDLFVGCISSSGICATRALLRKLGEACLRAADAEDPKICVPVSLWGGVSTGAEYGQVCVNVVSITRFHSRIRICGSHGMIHAKDCFEHVRSCEQLHYDHCEVPFTADTKPDFGDDPEPT